MFRSSPTRRSLVAIATALVTCPPLTAQVARRSVADQIARRIDKLPKNTQVGVIAMNASDGSIWCSHQSDIPLKPGSVIKLFVMAAAIEHLGPDFAFSTDVYLNGDELWIVGGGDPGFGDPRLAARRGEQVLTPFEQWAERLSGRGTKSLGKIVLDDSVFDRQFRHDDWPADQSNGWYQAPVGGLNVNDNCLDAKIVVSNRRMHLELVPNLPLSFVDNRLAFGSKNDAVIDRLPDSDVFVLSGSVSKTAQLGPICARRPSPFFGHALRRSLAARDINVRNGVARRKFTRQALDGAMRIAEHRTPLADVLWRSGVFSQNLFAECTLKALAAYERGGARRSAPGSWPEGISVLRTTLGGIGLDLSGAVIRDGSGLSPENRVTARQIGELLRIMRSRPQSKMFVSNLAVPGRPGTLRRRFRDSPLAERLRAKTGTIRDVSALAGYLERPDGTTLAFAVLVNGNTKAAREFENDIVRILLESG